MEQVLEREELIKKYLLGELAGDEQAEVEIRVLTDQGYFNELLLVEDEITDDFVSGTLSGHEQERTRDYFLAVPERRQKLKFIKALEQYASESDAEDTADTVNDDILSEAQRNRVLLESLINGDWMGMHLIALLRLSSQKKADLAVAIRTDDATITPILNRLILSGVIEEYEGLFACTELGARILRKIEEASGVEFTP
ncbi:MAG: hypothetical protein AUG51_09135 [Acidobacteria bacterium 13_1_20CM_3_53_8]|nr:MAG: hypothetical protein AUG51_09135 [Acidobacteria bacterium 13_1_20CM_3_53_8]